MVTRRRKEKKEAAELKQKKLEERQQKEEERKCKQEERKKRQQAAEENLRAKVSRKRLREAGSTSAHHKLSMTEDSPNEEEEIGPCAVLGARPKRRCQLPARFWDSDTESDDDVLCSMCNQKELAGCFAETIFRIDCDVCLAWVHTYCAFKDNASYNRYMCKSCIC